MDAVREYLEVMEERTRSMNPQPLFGPGPDQRPNYSFAPKRLPADIDEQALSNVSMRDYAIWRLLRSGQRLTFATVREHFAYPEQAMAGLQDWLDGLEIGRRIASEGDGVEQVWWLE